MSPWLVRISVLSALGLTLWLAGPRAWAVVARASSRAVDRGPRVELGAVGFVTRPAWLQDALLVAVSADLEPVLRGELGMLDEDGTRALRRRLDASPWVREAALHRLFPDRMRATMTLRRPEVLVFRDGRSDPEVLVDGVGHCLPAVAEAGVPRTAIPAGGRSARPGELHPDDRVRAAARVAEEWRLELAPRVEGAPRLVEVDASNLGYRFLPDGRWAEVRIGLERGDGGVAWLAYGHPPGTPAPRVPAETKAEILRRLLAARPGLAGVESGDLRFVHRWRDWVRPRRP